VRIGVLGTGTVGQTLAAKLVELGHQVRMGSRDAANEKAASWAAGAGEHASTGTFADAADFGELVLNCTAGAASLQALEQAGEDALRGKVLIDVTNPLDFSGGMPPSLTVCNTDSLGEQIQRRFPETRVVCGDDDAAKSDVVELLESFDWPRGRIVNLGGIDGARATEMYLPLWLRLFGAFGTPQVNIRVAH
jgi:predicted dinucleotide-binding enzyme